MLPESKENIQLDSTLILIPVFNDWEATFSVANAFGRGFA